MKLFKSILFVSIALTLLSGCAITHKYGPYMGQVIDKETEGPIEGAVVFMRYYTEGFGGTSKFEDAVEVLTDTKGEFVIPANRIGTLRPLSWWDEHPPVIIFKPGYGAFPGHLGTEPRFGLGGSMPENQHVTIRLPKLKTKEERKRNLRNISFTADIPYEKWRHLFEYRNSENIHVGFPPYKVPHEKDE